MASNTTSDKADQAEFKSLLGPMDPKVDHEAREKLIGARVSLLLKQAFFGNLATRLKLVNSDEWLGTLATDGRNFYYNSRFVMMLDQKEIEFGFGHEVLHCVYDHFGRRGSRHPKIWNIANDYCVNADLVNHNIGRKITTVKILYDRKYQGMPSEEVYEKLMENVKEISLDELADMLLDEHLDGDGDGDEKDGRGRPKMSKEERDAIRDEFKEAVINAASNEPNAGNIPGNVRKMLKDLTEPQMDWRELLNLTLTSAIKDDYTWMRPSRRSWHMDAIMPGMNPGEAIDIAVAIDTSGSISQTMLLDFLSEVQGAMESFTAYKIHVFCFDTSVHNPVTYVSDDICDMGEYELGGFGGTDFVPIFKHLRENDVNPDRLVVFTDGYPYGSWGDEDLCDTLWVIHGSTSIEAPFGTTTYYTDHVKGK
jgi:predicted metal-dependent peptidase